jgi:hypothetical protein
MVSTKPSLLYFWRKSQEYRLDDRTGGSLSQSGCGEKILGMKDANIQITASHFTDLAISCIKIIPNSKKNLHSHKLYYQMDHEKQQF